ncbi:aspartyl-phosphate phosphatase Spo0E family protein [Brevibacillus laterosporus]|uniref:aspartyl-phosphate phosphatase Spo0E family protein n=1 Tax=Brevibacillus laterosporus TaxID=1465 RepID=UPI002E250F42|nr:aspartyl-phosphate phosphatase Spo0E family protein [Brevibacillus laterosporus]
MDDLSIEKDIPQLHSKGTSSSQSLDCVTTLSQNDGELQNDLEVLRQKLVKLVSQEGSFSSPAVLQISQQLDEYIVSIQKITKTIK